MALTITHSQVAGTGVDADAIVDGADWDAAHTISGSVAAAEVTSGAALTQTNDTNVTLTLGGTPTTALLQATSITVGWTGSLAVERGGMGAATHTAHGVLLGQGTSAVTTLDGSAGNSSLPLISQGASLDPVYSTIGFTAISGWGAGVTTFLGTPSSANLASAITDETGSGALVFGTSPSLTTPALGVATGTSLALNGATLGSNKLAVSGTTALVGDAVVTSSSGTALTVGPNGASSPVLTIDGSAGSGVTGLKIAGSATGGTVNLLTTDTGANNNLTINAKGTGTIGIGTTSTGAVSVANVTLTRPATAATLTIANNKTLTASNTLTLTGTDGVTVPFGTRTRQTFTSGTSQTYTTPANVKYIVARIIGGGGGGGGSSGGTSGTAGNASSFSTATANGGGAGLSAGNGGAGGTTSGGTLGVGGNAGLLESTLGTGAIGGQGGSSHLGGAGVGGSLGGAGGAAATNSGSGGGGGGSTLNNTAGGGGGGSGGFIEFLITAPAATYTYTVGGTAAGGTAGGSGGAGGTGAAGIIIVDEFYQ
jgi:hypothetical protein